MEKRTDFGDIDVWERFRNKLVELDELVEFERVVDIDD